MKKHLLAASFAALASVPVSANPVFDIYAGAQHWGQNYEGFVRDLESTTGSSRVDLETDLGFDDDNGSVIYVTFEHPVPLIPNIKLQQTELETDATNQLTGSFGFDDETFTSNITAEIDLSHTDATFYWEILDNYVSLDVGLTARWFDGEVKIQENGTSTSANEKLDAVIPLLYTAVRIDLPLSGLYASVSGNFLGTSDNNFLDYQATIGYESAFRLGVEAGYRSLELNLDDVDDIEADITIDGAFIGLFVHF